MRTGPGFLWRRKPVRSVLGFKFATRLLNRGSLHAFSSWIRTQYCLSMSSRATSKSDIWFSQSSNAATPQMSESRPLILGNSCRLGRTWPIRLVSVAIRHLLSFWLFGPGFLSAKMAGPPVVLLSAEYDRMCYMTCTIVPSTIQAESFISWLRLQRFPTISID